VEVYNKPRRGYAHGLITFRNREDGKTRPSTLEKGSDVLRLMYYGEDSTL